MPGSVRSLQRHIVLEHLDRNLRQDYFFEYDDVHADQLNILGCISEIEFSHVAKWKVRNFVGWYCLHVFRSGGRTMLLAIQILVSAMFARNG